MAQIDDLRSRTDDQLVEQLAERGFVPHRVPMGEFRKAGGAVKCCTLELRS